MIKTRDERLRIADEMIRRAETVTILRGDECEDIYERALLGEYDTIFDDKETHPAPEGK